MEGMRALIFACLFVCTSHAAPTPGADADSRMIRVRIFKAEHTVSIKGLDLDIEAKGRHSTARGMAALRATCLDGKVHLTVERRDKGQNMGNRQMLFSGAVTIHAPARFLAIQGSPYRDKVTIYPMSRTCELVNTVDLEKYLEGLINEEFSSKWSPEAVKAQVISARTYALSRIITARKNPRSHFDVYSTTKDQVYLGAHSEDFRTARLVSDTRGMVLTHKQADHDEPIVAYYHSTCGGKTELPENVWGHAIPGFSRTVQCPYCRSSPAYAWETELTESSIRSGLLDHADHDGISKKWPRIWKNTVGKGRLTDLRTGEVSEVPRLAVVRAKWELGKQEILLEIPTLRLRSWIGESKLKSTTFHVYRKPNGEWLAIGRGNGHGVGLCQWGAKVMGEGGKTAAEILAHYYPDATLTHISFK